jgi:hypothetical protein
MTFTPKHLAAVGGRKVTPALDQVDGLAWTYPLDPVELQPFTVDFVKELEATGAAITAAVWTLPAAAVLGGLEAAAATSNRTEATVWFQVNATHQADAGYTNGADYPIALKVTDSIGRIYRRIITLKVDAR